MESIIVVIVGVVFVCILPVDFEFDVWIDARENRRLKRYLAERKTARALA